jgi:hypothetical protein
MGGKDHERLYWIVKRNTGRDGPSAKQISALKGKTPSRIAKSGWALCWL